jgi:hypothetical protein
MDTIGPDFFWMHCEGATYWDCYNRADAWPSYMTFQGFRIWDMWDTSGRFPSGCAWGSIHTGPSTCEWGHFDAVLDLLATKGIAGANTMYTFGYTPTWSNTVGNTALPPDDLAVWEEFVWEIVSRAAGRIKIWGLWNEPNAWPQGDGVYWKTTAEALAELGFRAYSIIKKVDPTAIVVSPEGQGNCGGWMGDYWAAGGADCCDVVGVHYYDVANFQAFHDSVKANMALYGVSKPIWHTEFGFETGADVSNTAYLTKQYVLSAANGMKRVIWYSPDDSAFGTMWTEAGGLNVTPA